MPSFPEHGPGPSLLDAIVVDPGGAIDGVLAFQVEREPEQGRGIARKVRSDAHGGPPAVNALAIPSDAKGSNAIAASPTASQPGPHAGSMRWDLADRTTNRPDGRMSRNRCATWAVR